MYAVFKDNDVIAFHDSLDVCEIYTDLLYKHHGVHFDIQKVKKKRIEKLDELYLTRFGSTYVQSGYLLYIQLASEQLIDDVRMARDVMYGIIENGDLPSKKMKTLKKSIKILEDIYDGCISYTPMLDELKRMKIDYDPYIYNYSIY